jgi:hypothetical protein
MFDRRAQVEYLLFQSSFHDTFHPKPVEVGDHSRRMVTTARLCSLLCVVSMSTACSVIFDGDFDVGPSDDPADARDDDVATKDTRGNGNVDAINDASIDISDRVSDVVASRDVADVMDLRDVAVDAPSRDTPYDHSSEVEGGGSVADATVDGTDVGGNPGDVGVDAMDAGTDVNDAGPPSPDGGRPPTITMWSFDALGPAARHAGSLELRGQILSPAFVRGGSANGLTLEGRFR